ncbi:MAG TPA: hypothetical protein VLL52_03450 [Anaerolineae bacterium]|nr:hypothetical protein [Anaerolineae bacterium]
MSRLVHWLSEQLEWIEEESKPFFLMVALGWYFFSLYQLMFEVNPVQDLNGFLVGALSNLSIPFGVILMQEVLELIASISHSTLLSARRQFEIVILVLIRSFFKSFAKVNEYVSLGEFSPVVQASVIKVLAIIVMTALLIIFRKIASEAILKSYVTEGRLRNEYKQLSVLLMVIVVFILYLIDVGRGFDNLTFISLIFTGLIVIDAVFLIVFNFRDTNFDGLLFESSLVISLIFARFPLFSTERLAYWLSIIGVSFATLSLYLLWRSRQVTVVLHDEHHEH